jgi:hypothetical protein
MGIHSIDVTNMRLQNKYAGSICWAFYKRLDANTNRVDTLHNVTQLTMLGIAVVSKLSRSHWL